jgi:hypothetical protein
MEQSQLSCKVLDPSLEYVFCVGEFGYRRGVLSRFQERNMPVGSIRILQAMLEASSVRRVP